jgi:hypothetical protein
VEGKPQMSEEEEFEFRLRLEQERGPSAPSQRDVRLSEPKAQLGKFGKLAADMGQAVMTAATPWKALPEFNKQLEGAGYQLGQTVTDQAAKVLPPEVAAAGGFAANVATQALPMALGGQVAAKAGKPVMESVATNTMQRTIKPVIDVLEKGEAARAIDTMLKEGINVTPGGMAKLRFKINQLNNQIRQEILGSGATVDTFAVASRLSDALKKFEQQALPKADMKTLQGAWDEFLTHPLFVGSRNIPVEMAQNIKQGTYRSLGSKPYGELSGASIEAQKTLARGLKEEIAAAVPNVDRLNKQEGELLNALEVAARRVLMDSNKQGMGIGWVAPSKGQMLAYAVEKSPLVRSLLARLSYSGSESIPRTAGSVAGAAYGSNVVGAEP